ncbi:MAG: META domain-containing protein, partial [Candidatus Electrothrix sp. ATG1]|nr:META domain-containing protein [Candidatus Electrothrix sp. ATG1]
MDQDISATTPIQAEIGVWRYNEKRRTVHLSSYNKTVRTLAVTGKHTLKLLKVSGGMMPSLVRYDFILTDAEPSYEGVVRMQGMYTRRRGRGVLQECLSGVSFPVVKKNRQVELDRAFQEILHGRSESLFVALDVRLSSRPGRGDRLVQLRSVNIEPYRSCNEKKRRIVSITDNRWYLIELKGNRPGKKDVSTPPFLKVQGEEQLIQGFAGCNNFTGSWFFTGNDFVFNRDRIATARMACPVGMEVEDAFLQALDNTRRYTIRGDILSLRDRRGRVLARMRYSRELTELDFRYLSPEQDKPEDVPVPSDNTVEVAGTPPNIVKESVTKREIRLKPSWAKNIHKGRQEVTILKGTKKVAVRDRTAQTEIQPGKEVIPSPKPSVSPAVGKEQEPATKTLPAPEDEGKKVTGPDAENTTLPDGRHDEKKEAAPILPPPIPEQATDGQETHATIPAPVDETNITEPEVEEKPPANDMSPPESLNEETKETDAEATEADVPFQPPAPLAQDSEAERQQQSTIPDDQTPVQTRLPSISSCNQPWKTPLAEIN